MGQVRDSHVKLTSDERKLLKHEMKNATPTRVLRCNILLQADESNAKNKAKGFTIEEIANRSGAAENTVRETINSFCTDGIVGALTIKRNENSNLANKKILEEYEIKIVSTMESKAPEGFSRWTISLLHSTVAASCGNISRSSVANVVKKHDLRPYIKRMWVIPPEHDADFAYHMEDIIQVYRQPIDPKRPVYCVDEKPFQLLDEARQPIPMKPGRPERIDSTYIRCGTVSISCVVKPADGTIYQRVSPTRSALDFAQVLKWIANDLEPNAEKIILIYDNLNTHTLASLYKAFPPEEAWKIARRFEIHTTPKHASWLDLAEVAINVMTKQCLDRRIESIEHLTSELNAWQRVHNAAATPFRWFFTVEDARVKMKRVYPDLKENWKAQEKLKASKTATAN